MQAAQDAPLTALPLLRRRRNQARALRHKLDEFVHVADSRLAKPHVGSTVFSRPIGTDWSWRPALWRGPLADKGMAGVRTKTGFGGEIMVFHDCSISELMLRQMRNTSDKDLAPFGLRMEVFRFDGSFLSLVLDLPGDSCAGLKKRHILRVDTVIEVEKPLDIYFRLNIKHGPNTEQLVSKLPMDHHEAFVEFDLGYSSLNEKRVERIWVDMIFDGAEMNRMTVRDITFSRHPRAEL
jgi:hypothetical protein